MPDSSRRTVGILIFPDVEVLDFAGPFEVFSVARPVDEHDDAQRLFQPLTIAATDDIVSCRGGLKVQPDATIAEHPPLDLLIAPGGRGVAGVLNHHEILSWLTQQSATTEITASVCTGALLLAHTGLLGDAEATTHWDSLDVLRRKHSQVRDDLRYVDAGHIVTSAGISAGIDMSLHLVARLHGPAVATWTARRMEYNGDWQNPATGIPAIGDTAHS